MKTFVAWCLLLLFCFNFLSCGHRNQRIPSAYYDFIEQHREYGKRLSKRSIIEEIEKVNAMLKSQQDSLFKVNISPSDLKEIITESLNIGFLLKDLGKESTIATVISEKEHNGYIERKLLFKDEHVGMFNVLMLMPIGVNRPRPVVIGLHGHGDHLDDSAEDSEFSRLVKELVQKGFMVLLPLFRAMDHDAIEFDISKALLLNGFTLMGIRIYETLLVIEYIGKLDFADSRKIGIVGHSGGSHVANLVARMTDTIKAKVVDMNCTDSLNGNLGPSWLNSCINKFSSRIADEIQWRLGNIHCSTVPQLFYYQKAIVNENTLKASVLKAPYISSKVHKLIVDFFVTSLKSDR